MIVLEGPTHKLCVDCHELKPIGEEFWVYTGKKKNHLRSQCKVCWNSHQKKLRKLRHEDPIKRQQYLDNKRERKMWKYGMGQAEFELMSADQDDRCAICRAKAKLHVDHDHNTGKVRALLCSPCNTSLGLMKENPQAITRMIDYIKEHG